MHRWIRVLPLPQELQSLLEILLRVFIWFLRFDFDVFALIVVFAVLWLPAGVSDGPAGRGLSALSRRRRKELVLTFRV